MLHPEKHHNGESADSQKTATEAAAAGTLCVYVGVEGGGKFVLIREAGRSSSLGERMGDSSGFFLTDPSSFSTTSVTLVIEVIGLVMIALFVLL